MRRRTRLLPLLLCLGHAPRLPASYHFHYRTLVPGGGPRIMAVPLLHARLEMRRMMTTGHAAAAAVVDAAEVEMVQRLYETKDEDQLGALALVQDRLIHAIVLIENVDGVVHVLSVQCDDFGSGTILISAMHKASHRKAFVFDGTVHDRWRIAFSYFLEDADDDPGDGPGG